MGVWSHLGIWLSGISGWGGTWESAATWGFGCWVQEVGGGGGGGQEEEEEEEGRKEGREGICKIQCLTQPNQSTKSMLMPLHQLGFELSVMDNRAPGDTNSWRREWTLLSASCCLLTTRTSHS